MMTDQRLVELLEEIGVDEASYHVLELLPLVLVAWADGEVQPEELEAVLDAARQRNGLPPTAAAVLERWLVERPSAEYVRKSLEALVELARRRRGPGADLAARDLRQLTELCRGVAHAAGGLWGTEAVIGHDEEAMIEHLASVLHIDDGHSWAELLKELE